MQTACRHHALTPSVRFSAGAGIRVEPDEAVAEVLRAINIGFLGKRYRLNIKVSAEEQRPSQRRSFPSSRLPRLDLKSSRTRIPRLMVVPVMAP